jgi:hypothetical protein
MPQGTRWIGSAALLAEEKPPAHQSKWKRESGNDDCANQRSRLCRFDVLDYIGQAYTA